MPTTTTAVAAVPRPDVAQLQEPSYRLPTWVRPLRYRLHFAPRFQDTLEWNGLTPQFQGTTQIDCRVVLPATSTTCSTPHAAATPSSPSPSSPPPPPAASAAHASSCVPTSTPNTLWTAESILIQNTIVLHALHLQINSVDVCWAERSIEHGRILQDRNIYCADDEAEVPAPPATFTFGSDKDAGTATSPKRQPSPAAAPGGASAVQYHPASETIQITLPFDMRTALSWSSKSMKGNSENDSTASARKDEQRQVEQGEEEDEEETTFTLTIKYQGRVNQQDRSGTIGLYRCDPDTDPNFLMTHLEPTNARQLYPCFDEPCFKATFQVSVDFDSTYQVVSGTLPVSEEIIPAGGGGGAGASSPSAVSSQPPATTTTRGSSPEQHAAATDYTHLQPSAAATATASHLNTGSTLLSPNVVAVGNNGPYPAGSRRHSAAVDAPSPSVATPPASFARMRASDVGLDGQPLHLSRSEGEAAAAAAAMPSAVPMVRRTLFKPTPLLSSYVVSFAIGKFHLLQQNTKRRGLLCRVLFPISDHLNEGWYALDLLTKAVDFYENFFQMDLPVEKLDIIGVSEFNVLGMENWGLMAFLKDYLLVSETTPIERRQRIARLIGHEVAHQWYGNLISVAWWKELWLKEGFCRYLEYFFVNHTFPQWLMWGEFLVMIFDEALQQDCKPDKTHPIESCVAEPRRIFDSFDLISYGKGASLLRMLAANIGEDRLEQAIQKLLRRFVHRAFTKEDFLTCVCEVLVDGGIVVAMSPSATTTDIHGEGGDATASSSPHGYDKRTLCRLILDWVSVSGHPLLIVRRESLMDGNGTGSPPPPSNGTGDGSGIASTSALEGSSTPAMMDSSAYATERISVSQFLMPDLSSGVLPYYLREKRNSQLTPRGEGLGYTGDNATATIATPRAREFQWNPEDLFVASHFVIPVNVLDLVQGQSSVRRTVVLDSSHSTFDHGIISSSVDGGGGLTYFNCGGHGVLRCDYDAASWLRVFEYAPFLTMQDRLVITMTLFRLRALHIGKIFVDEPVDRCTLLLEWLVHLSQQRTLIQSTLWRYITEQIEVMLYLLRDHPCWNTFAEFAASLYQYPLQLGMISFFSLEKPVEFQAQCSLTRQTIMHIIQNLAVCKNSVVLHEATSVTDWALHGILPDNSLEASVNAMSAAAGGIGGGGTVSASLNSANPSIGTTPTNCSMVGASGAAGFTLGITSSADPSPASSPQPLPPVVMHINSGSGVGMMVSGSSGNTALAPGAPLGGGSSSAPGGQGVVSPVTMPSASNTATAAVAAGGSGSGGGGAPTGGAGGSTATTTAGGSLSRDFDLRSDQDVTRATIAMQMVVEAGDVRRWWKLASVLAAALNLDLISHVPATFMARFNLTHIAIDISALATSSSSSATGEGEGGSATGSSSGGLSSPLSSATARNRWINILAPPVFAMDDPATFDFSIATIRCFTGISAPVAKAILRNTKLITTLLERRGKPLHDAVRNGLIGYASVYCSNANVMALFRCSLLGIDPFELSAAALSPQVATPPSSARSDNSSGGGDTPGGGAPRPSAHMPSSNRSSLTPRLYSGTTLASTKWPSSVSPSLIKHMHRIELNCVWVDYICEHYTKFLKAKRKEGAWAPTGTPQHMADSDPPMGGAAEPTQGVSI